MRFKAVRNMQHLLRSLSACDSAHAQSLRLQPTSLSSLQPGLTLPTHRLQVVICPNISLQVTPCAHTALTRRVPSLS